MSAEKGTRSTAATVKRAKAIEGNQAAVTSRTHYNRPRPHRQPHVDVFREVRERITAEEAARFYGLSLDRKGWALCPFHSDHHPSMSFKAGRYKCWSCNASGDSVDFVARLYGLTPLEAVRKLDADFHLNLPLDKPVTPQERRKAQREADRRAGITELYGAFETWRTSTINELNHCVYLGNLVERYMDDPGELSDLAALALRERERMEYLADTLTWGSPEEQAQLWAQREGVTRWTRQILRGY